METGPYLFRSMAGIRLRELWSTLSVISATPLSKHLQTLIFGQSRV